ncbi:MAG: ATP synthase F1 subunit delta [Clostridia bacterium]|nr:ATP synthase F1 subunit delta [Clostridia bacterium]
MNGVASEYAAALWALASEENLADTLSGDLGTLRAVLLENPAYVDFLATPSIPASERCEAAEKALGGGLHEYVVSFVKLLCERGHIREVFGCIDEYERLKAFADGISTALVKSAVPLSDGEKESLQASLEKKLGHRVRLDCVVDESLLGGVIVRVDGKVMDGSLRHKLSNIKEVITK